VGRFHVVDDHCNIAGGEDYGAFDTLVQAEAAIAEKRNIGIKGGCRCCRGWMIQTCEDRIRVHLGWTERQESRFAQFKENPNTPLTYADLMHYGPQDGIERVLTAEELASHKCHEYDPVSFMERMHEARDRMWKKESKKEES
jgi:hypothetical protein